MEVLKYVGLAGLALLFLYIASRLAGLGIGKSLMEVWRKNNK